MNYNRGSIFGNIPPAVLNLMIINLLFWFASQVFPTTFGIDLVKIFGLHYWFSDKFNPIQLVTYMFMHDTSSISHLFCNMFGIWMFGRTLEMVFGSKRFLTYYLVCGIGAGIVQEVIQYVFYATELVRYDSVNIGVEIVPMAEYLNMMTTVGASGAVYGILLAFGMLFPNSQMFVFPLPFPIKAKFFVIGYAVIELFLGLGQTGDGVAHFAHLGGMIFGFLLIMYWRKKSKNNGQFHY